MSVPEQGETYAGHIAAQLAAERERRKNLDARGLAMTTTSAAFVGLTVGLATLVVGKDPVVSAPAAVVVVLSLLAFVGAAVLGLVANAMREHEVTSGSTMVEMVTSHWTDDEVDARNQVAALDLSTVESLRTGSNSKAGTLRSAAVLQLVAVLLLVLAVVLHVSSVEA